MHDECFVGIAGTNLKWKRAVRDVPHDAVLHDTVYERLEMPEVRNFTSYPPRSETTTKPKHTSVRPNECSLRPSEPTVRRIDHEPASGQL